MSGENSFNEFIGRKTVWLVESLGSLYFDFGVDDKGFDLKLKSAMDKQKKLEMNAGVKYPRVSQESHIPNIIDVKNIFWLIFLIIITSLIDSAKRVELKLMFFH